MPVFSEQSRNKLDSCNERLRMLFSIVIDHFDCRVTDGYRPKSRQDEYYKQKKTKVQYPNSKHNIYPSRAVDVVPYPVDWTDRERFCYFAGFVMATTASLGIKLRWGGDFNQNTHIKDSNFIDMPHYELID